MIEWSPTTDMYMCDVSNKTIRGEKMRDAKIKEAFNYCGQKK